MILKNKLTQIILAGLAIEAICIQIVLMGDIKNDVPKFSVFYAVSFIIYIFSILFIIRWDITLKPEVHLPLERNNKKDSSKIFWAIIIFSFIFRLTLLPVAPSDDIYRYLWEGKLQLNYINPYTFSPESKELEHLRDKFFSGINHKNLTTIYPPITLMGFAIADSISYSIISMKSFFLFFDFLIILILIPFLKRLKLNVNNILVYAWSPLVLISFSARGHCDTLLLFFVMLALYFNTKGSKITPAISIAFAVLSKFIAIIVLPFLVLRKPKCFLIASLALILFYIPYISAGTNVFFTLFHFGCEYHFNDSLHFLISSLPFNSTLASRIISLSIFSIVLIVIYIKFVKEIYFPPQKLTIENNENILRYSFFTVGAFLMLAPTVHPWYLTWIVPFLCFYNSKAWLVLTGTIVFYYLMNNALFSSLIEYNNEWVWKEVHWLKLPEYIPFYSLLIYEFLNKQKLLK